MNTYEIGTRVTVRGTFRDTAGALADTTVVGKYKSPSGVVTTVNNPTNPSTGVYEFAITPDAGGVWKYRFEGTGNIIVTGQSYFVVEDDF